MMNLFDRIRSYSLVFAWIIALIGTLASLIAEYGFGLTPCMLCWYQRVCLYPLVIVLGIAMYRDDASISRYTIPLSSMGALLALYHYLEQKVPALKDAIRCSTGVPCSGHYIDWLGFITIPLLSLLAFGLITFFLAIAGKG